MREVTASSEGDITNNAADVRDDDYVLCLKKILNIKEILRSSMAQFS